MRIETYNRLLKIFEDMINSENNLEESKNNQAEKIKYVLFDGNKEKVAASSDIRELRSNIPSWKAQRKRNGKDTSNWFIIELKTPMTIQKYDSILFYRGFENYIYDFHSLEE